jgi:hypothetical protein
MGVLVGRVKGIDGSGGIVEESIIISIQQFSDWPFRPLESLHFVLVARVLA